MDICIENIDLIEGEDKVLLSSYSDIVRKERAAGKTGEGQFVYSPHENYGCSVELQKGDRLFLPQITDSAKMRVVANLVPLRNRFDILASEITCRNKKTSSLLTLGVGQAQDSLEKRPTLTVGGESYPKPDYYCEKRIKPLFCGSHIVRKAHTNISPEA